MSIVRIEPIKLFPRTAVTQNGNDVDLESLGESGWTTFWGKRHVN